MGESDIEAVLGRLDRLTQDEARMTVAQTLGVVHGLVGNMKVVMEGTESLHNCAQILTYRPASRRGFGMEFIMERRPPSNLSPDRLALELLLNVQLRVRGVFPGLKRH